MFIAKKNNVKSSVIENNLSRKSHTELAYAMDEVDLVMSYLCRTSGKINKTMIEEIIIARRQYLAKGVLPINMEISFWYSYHHLMNAIKPVTLASIQQSNPSPLWEKKNPIIVKRIQRVPLYYGICICIVILLTITLQTYYMIGIDVLKKTHQLFNDRNILKAEITKLKAVKDIKNIQQLNKLESAYEKLDQEFDANRILLYDWNSFWQLGEAVKPKFSKYDNYIYHYQYDQISQTINKKHAQVLSKSLHELILHRRLNESRNLFYRGRLAAVNVVNLLESYLLPLLFGCLGAFTLVLRTLHNTFQQGTFTLKLCLDFNLRILLGGVMGISSGMFLGKNLVVPEEQFSPMLTAFIIGYNVEILFSIMDNFAQRLAIDNKKETQKQGQST